MKGLSPAEVEESRSRHGSNALQLHGDKVFRTVLWEIVKEPMFLLLLATCSVYLIARQYQESLIMLLSLFIVAGISLFQEYRSRNAIKALNKLSSAKARVIRDGVKTEVGIDEIVVDDVLLLEEGEIIPADAMLLESRDFSLNESILTGESASVFKNRDDKLFRGTLVVSGNATACITAVGPKTEFGKIGHAVEAASEVKTPLQQQIRSFVKYMVWVGAVAFLVVVAYNYYRSGELLPSFLQGLTLAMSILPEEIPVAFSTFQALGAFRLLRNNIIVKQPQHVETLGAATVICADKTGTLTENRMRLAEAFDTGKWISVSDPKAFPPELVEYAMWSSETDPFDPMEKSIHELYGSIAGADKRKAHTQVHEYPVGGTPPMMTHVFRNKIDGMYVIAAKGAPERLYRHSTLTPEKKLELEEKSLAYARRGLRVLAVGKSQWPDTAWPESQDSFRFDILGLIAFEDPPKKQISETIRSFEKAGIKLKMITGDYAETALAIAKQIGLSDHPGVIKGGEVMEMSKKELRERVNNVQVFARMFPEAKLKVIEALKENGEVVAMTGDGVNDAPALKAAHIGIAMGKRGSEVAKGAASLVLTDDDLSHMTDAVALGRKIYDNLKKAIQYIVSIHIPILLIVTLPLLLGWGFTDIFFPVHVIFLELIMGPTCSIIYENEPMEPGTMERPPRKMTQTFLTLPQLTISIIQGLIITAGCLGIGYYTLKQGQNEELIRTVIFITLLFANIFLTLVNRSFRHSVLTTIKYKNPLVPLIIGITILFIVCLLSIPALHTVFGLQPLSLQQIATCAGVAALSTFWINFRIRGW